MQKTTKEIHVFLVYTEKMVKKINNDFKIWCKIICTSDTHWVNLVVKESNQATLKPLYINEVLLPFE